MHSSAISRRGLSAMARASSSRRCSTWVSSRGSFSAFAPSSTCSRQSIARSVARAASPPKSSGTRTFSSTVRLAKGCGSWNVRARPSRARRCGLSPSSGRPSSMTLPSCWAKSPLMQLTKVLLPEPFGPISPSRSPARSVMSTSWSATKPPKRLPTPSARRRSGAPPVTAASGTIP